MRRERVLAVVLLLMFSGMEGLGAGEMQDAAVASAQDAAELQREAIQKLEPWVGHWEGSGWIIMGRSRAREAFTITETVQGKLGGRVLLVEGRGRGKDPQTGAEVDTHNTLAVLSYDEKAKVYRFRTHEATGRALDVEPRLIDGGLEWGFRDESRGATIRFTIQLNGHRWHEVGEASLDGKTWHRFLEMTLERRSSAAP